MSKLMFLGAALLLIAPSAHAQVRATARADTTGCGRAVAAARSEATPAEVDRALGRLAGCDAAAYGPALAHALQRARGSDRAALWRYAQWIRDASVFRAALAVAADPRAATPARVGAFRALAVAVDPHLAPSYEEMVQRPAADRRTGDRGACILSKTTGGVPLTGEPLPLDARAQLEALARKVYDGSGEPGPVRAAAWCAVSHR
jgi:hypothetical protein